MSAAFGRRVGKAAGRASLPAAEENTLESLLSRMEREAHAVRTLVAFARALAGTGTQPGIPPVASRKKRAPVVKERSTGQRSPSRPITSPVRKWSKTVRPGPHDILTWDEVMTVPWINGIDDHEPESN